MAREQFSQDLEKPEQIMDILPEDVTLRLGVLASRPMNEIRVNLGVRPYGTALLLETYGIVNYRDHGDSALQLAKNPEDKSAATMVRVTELGEKVMSICQTQLPEGDERDELSKNVLEMH